MDCDPEAEADVEIVKKACLSLGEHFDSVHIFATRHEPATLDGTVTVAYGSGNWFARYGQIQEWMIKQDEQARLKVRTDSLEDE
jgi:hypothetical protein